MDQYEEELLEPIKYFRELSYRHEDNIKDYFDNLTARAGTDIGANKQTCDEYYNFKQQCDVYQKKMNTNKGLKGFLIFLTVLFFVAAGVFTILCFVKKDLLAAFIPSAIGSIAIAVVLIIINVKIVSQSVKKYKKLVDEFSAKAEKKKSLAQEQMATLNSLYDWNITSSLITETAPIIKMDKTFTVERCSHLAANYGWKMGNPDNVSTVFAQSGTIIGNPFVYERDFVQQMYDKTYTGTLTITWTTVVSDGKGGTRTVHHTQTLTATVVKPAARYRFNLR